MKKILITGGAGFIGSHIVDLLIKKDYDIILVDNLSTGKKEYINEKAKFYEADITRDINYIFEKEKPEIVIHAAAQVMLRKSLKEPINDAMINIIGTLRVLEACRKNNVKKIIYTSTGGARVGEPEYLPVDEKHHLNPCSPYGISKHSAEHYVLTYHKLYNIECLIFCFGNVYGPRDDPSTERVIPTFIDLILKGESPKIFGDGNQTRDFIYVKDLAEFIVESINKNPKEKLFHLAYGKEIKVNDVFNILKKISGFNKDPEYHGGIKGEVRNLVLDISLAKKELGLNPLTDIERGIEETFKWFKENKK